MLRKQLFQSNAPQACELRMIKKDKTAFWVRISATPPRSVPDTDGAPASRLVLSDITERKEVEQENTRLLAQLQQARTSRHAGSSKGPGKGGSNTT
jgi:PAS domain-containing protein